MAGQEHVKRALEVAADGRGKRGTGVPAQGIRNLGIDFRARLQYTIKGKNRPGTSDCDTEPLASALARLRCARLNRRAARQRKLTSEWLCQVQVEACMKHNLDRSLVHHGVSPSGVPRHRMCVVV